MPNDTATQQPQTGGAVTQVNPVVAMRDTISKMEADFRSALPAHVPSAKFVRTAITALQLNPDATELCATPEGRRSVQAACMRAAADGLIIDGREAAMVTFNTKVKRKTGEEWVKQAQYMPMVAGLMKKARNSGEIASLAAHVVYEKDEFTYVLGDDESISHKPSMDAEPGKVVAVYAIAKLKDGTRQREVMSVAQVEKVRRRSRSADKGPWVSDWDEMARKTVIRRLSKYLPSSTDRDTGKDLIETIRADDDYYQMTDGDQGEPQTGSDTATQQGNAPAPDRQPRGRRQRGAAATILSDAPPAKQDEMPLTGGGSNSNITDAEHEVIDPETGEITTKAAHPDTPADPQPQAQEQPTPQTKAPPAAKPEDRKPTGNDGLGVPAFMKRTNGSAAPSEANPPPPTSDDII